MISGNFGKRAVALLLAVLIISAQAGLFCRTAAAQTYGSDEVITSSEWKAFEGEGTASDPFQISCYEDLARMRDFVNKGVTYKHYCFAQTTDITFPDGVNWIPIGNPDYSTFFSGTYDGQGHTLSNVRCNAWRAGLFRYLDGEVRNLGIESGSFTGHLVGCISSYNTNNAVLFNCYNKAAANGVGRAGGIADNMAKGKVINCWNAGEVTCEAGVVGQIVCYTASEITGCVSAKPYEPNETNKAAIKDCYTANEENLTETVERFNRMLYHAGVERETNVTYLQAGENGLCFREAGDKPAVVKTEERKAFLVSYGPLLFLALCALLYAVWMTVRILKNRIDLHAAAAQPVEEAQPAEEPGQKKKRRLNLTGELALFLALLLVGLYIADATLQLKKKDGGVIIMEAYYAQPKDTIDVLIVGSSKVGMNLDVETFWRENGLSTYILWGSSQPVWNSYYYLKEALEYNRPKVVAVEVSTLSKSSLYSDQPRQYANLCGMKLSLNKLQAVRASAEQGDWLMLLQGSPLYHSRYAELTDIDFSRYAWNAASFANEKGTFLRYKAAEQALEDASDITACAPLPEKQEYYLMEIIDLCREEQLPLVFVATQTWERIDNQPYYNTVAKIADQNGIPFINFNLMDRELAFTNRDMYPDTAGHQNASGARKNSQYLSHFLAETYDLTDHRGDERYQSWETFSHQTINNYFKLITGRKDYLSELARNDRTVIFVKKDVAQGDDLSALCSEMQAAGLYPAFLDTPDDGCWIMESTRDSEQIISHDPGRKQSLVWGGKEMTIDMRTANSIVYDKDKVLSIGKGIHCLVYDHYTQTVVDTFKLY